MIKINIVIDLRAKFEETKCVRLEQKKKKKNACNVTNLVPDLDTTQHSNFK